MQGIMDHVPDIKLAACLMRTTLVTEIIDLPINDFGAHDAMIPVAVLDIAVIITRVIWNNQGMPHFMGQGPGKYLLLGIFFGH